MTRKRDARGTLRDYEREYRRFGASEEAKKDRAARNKARRSALRTGRVHRGDGLEIDHIKGLSEGGSSNSENTRVVSRSFNRSRHQSSRRRGSRRNRRIWGK